MKIVLSGYYGFNNTGDEAILDTLVSELRSIDPETEITALSADPSQTHTDFKIRSINRLDLFSIIRELKNADIFVSGGGGLLQDSTGSFTVAYYLSLLFLARFLGCKTFILAQGYGPVNNPINKWLVKMILNSADLITVRDDGSFKELRKTGVHYPPMLLTADPTFLMENTVNTDIPELSDKGKKILGVSVRPLIDKNPDFRNNMAAALDRIIEAYDVRVIFVPFQLPVDADESVKIIELMKNKAGVLTQRLAPRELLNIISKTDYFIGMRLHSLMFSIISSVPAIGINYDPKVKDLLNIIGSPCLNAGAAADELLNAFEELWKNREQISSKLKEKAHVLKSKAKLNFTAFSEYGNPSKEIKLFGIKINNLTLESSVRIIDSFIKSGRPHIVFTPNPEIILAAQKNQVLREVLNSADLNIPDGIGILIASKLLKMPLTERVTGIDLMLEMLELAKKNNYKVFLLGSAPSVAEEAAKKLSGINVVGTHYGYFKESEEQQVIKKIKNVRPDILFVGLGAPKQEMWLSRHCKDLGVPVSMVIGGSLDVISGRVGRAPQIFQKIGLEWLYRLTKEPKRFRRQLKLAEFMWMVFRQRLFMR